MLVVEDDPFVGMMLVSALTQAGCVAHGPLGSSRHALACIASEAVDVVVLDIGLKDGPCHAVAARLIEAGIPFVLVTGRGRLPEWSARAACVLSKPCSPEDVIAVVADVLLHRRRCAAA